MLTFNISRSEKMTSLSAAEFEAAEFEAAAAVVGAEKVAEVSRCPST